MAKTKSSRRHLKGGGEIFLILVNEQELRKIEPIGEGIHDSVPNDQKANLIFINVSFRL